jgi:hypothetical protein
VIYNLGATEFAVIILTLSSAEREALGVKLSLQAFEKQLRILRTLASPREPIRVIIRQDNQSVVAAIRKQGSTEAGIVRIVEAFMREAFENGILL